MGKWCSRYYTPEKTWPFPPLRFASVLACFYSFLAFLHCSGRSGAGGGAVGLSHAVQGSCHLPTRAQEAAAHGRWPSASPLPRDSGLSPPAPPSNLCLSPSTRFRASPWQEENVWSLIPQLRISQSRWMIKYHKTVCRTAEEKKIQTRTDTSHASTEKRAMGKQPQALETSTTLVLL